MNDYYPPPPAPQQPPPNRGQSPLIVVVAVVVIGVVGWYLFFRPGASPVTLPVVPPAAADHSTGNICYALSDAEISAAMHKPPLAPGSGIDQGGIRNCTWSVWFSPAEYAGLSLTDASAFTTSRVGNEETISGIGNGAYWQPILKELVISIPKGTLSVIIESSTVDPRAAAIQLGTLAAPRV